MTSPLVVAVVLNWNLPEDTIRCVRSLLTGDYAALRVLIVDNGSSDDSLAIFARELPAISVLAMGMNRFYAGGNNAGIAEALRWDAEWVLVLNNDTVAAPDMLSRLVEAGIRCGAAAVAPLIYRLDAPDTVWDAGTVWPRWRPLPRRATPQASAYPVDLATGCALLLRRDALDRVGALDERYVMYYEDADLCLRLRQAGECVVVEPQARLWHAAGQSAALASVRSARQWAHYRLRFYRQHAPWPWRPVTLAAVTAHVLWRSLSAVCHGRRESARAYGQGCIDGWRDAPRARP
ncbi:MAG: glycosyltransferase family 2 protein [Anaerolineales bacterium]